MKVFETLQPVSKEYLRFALKEKFKINLENFDIENHPQEDFILSSEKYPIFVVADGVTLIHTILQDNRYPNPSPSGEVTRIFCEEFIKVAESKYSEFNEASLKESFKAANEKVHQYNESKGRTKETINYWELDFYSATAAFFVIKDNTVYWGSVCDSYFIHIDSQGKLLLQSPRCHTKAEADPPPFLGDKDNQEERAIYNYSKRRNAINEKGELIGYGIVTGEETVSKYLNFGHFNIHKDEIVAILTDGFESYLELPEFVSLFLQWPNDIEEKFKDLSQKMLEKDLDKFGHERSLILVKF